jgi:hypothetical protein
MSKWIALSFVLMTACTAARINQAASAYPEDPGVVRGVVLEPFFEVAEWKTTTRTEFARVDNVSPFAGAFQSTSPFQMNSVNQVPVTITAQEKPLFARVDMLSRLHDLVIRLVQQRRPNWKVTSTSGGATLAGPLTLVRTIISQNERVESDRALKNAALAFGFFIPPLQLVHLDPVHETERLTGLIEKTPTDANFIKSRMVKYSTQPDAAVNLSQVELAGREFALDVAYIEGILADEKPRAQTLLEGFSDLLATAVIALVEEVK